MKTGFKTSEFALALLGPIAALTVVVASAFGYTLDAAQLIAVGTFLISHAGLAVGYAHSRAKVKVAAADAARTAEPPKESATVQGTYNKYFDLAAAILKAQRDAIPAPPVAPVDPPSDGLTAALAVINA